MSRETVTGNKNNYFLFFSRKTRFSLAKHVCAVPPAGEVVTKGFICASDTIKPKCVSTLTKFQVFHLLKGCLVAGNESGRRLLRR